MNKNFWTDKTVLITGHTGFKGSWLAIVLKMLGAKIYGISREEKNGIYKIDNLADIFHNEYFLNLGGSNLDNIQDKLGFIKPDIIFHLAAQSLVSVGFKNPFDTLNSNILGSFNIIQAATTIDNLKSLIISTTDKVYLNSEKNNKEDSQLGGKDFYSMSKVGVENLIEVFKANKYNFNISTVRSGNVLGGGDRGEDRLITDLNKAINSSNNFYSRQPDSVRPWQYILDSIYGYLLVAEENFENNVSEKYNLNSEPNNKYTAEYISKLYIKKWKSNIDFIPMNEKSFDEKKILKIDSTKAKKRLGWKPIIEIDELIEKIVNWEKNHSNNISNLTYSENEVAEYFKKI